MRRATRAALVAAAALATPAGGDDAPDFARFVALGDGLTAGFVNGSLFDGATADTPQRLGQRESFALRVAEALGAEATAPLVGWPGRAPRVLRVREAGICGYEPLMLKGSEQGRSARLDPSVRATILAVPGHTAADAIGRTWSLDPASPSTIDTDEDMILGQPWAAEGAPPRSQLETAFALEPTFATVWFGVEELLSRARLGEDSQIPAAADFEERLESVVGALAEHGVRGAVANVPDVTTFSLFVPHEDLRAFLADDRGERVRHVALRMLFGVHRGAYLVGDKDSFSILDDIANGVQRAPVKDDHVLHRGEARRLARFAREYSEATARVAARHDWALADVASLFRSWKRDGVEVGGRKLTTAVLGGLFDMTGDSLSPTAHALVAAEFLRAIDAKYGTSHVAPDAAAVLAVDPLAPCPRESK